MIPSVREKEGKAVLVICDEFCSVTGALGPPLRRKIRRGSKQRGEWEGDEVEREGERTRMRRRRRKIRLWRRKMWRVKRRGK